jgi:hypothetical protein
MTIKTFKSFFAENDAKDYIAPKDSDDEVKDIKPRSKGEVDFKDSHKMTHTKHPVAGDHQFDGSIKEIKEEVCECSSEKEAYDKASENDSANVGALQDKYKACVERYKKNNQNESVEVVSEDAWSDLQTIAKTLASKNSSGKVKFKNGKQEIVDMGTAKQIVTVLNKLNSNNKKKAIDTLNKDPAGLMKVLDIVHKA